MTLIEKMSYILLCCGMVVLLVMMAFINVDVIARYFFSRPIPGSTEFVSVCLVVVSFFCLALTQFQKRHITITVIIDLMRPRVRLYLDAILALVCAIFTILIMWQTYEQGVSDMVSHCVSPIMVIPMAPFRFVAAFATLLFFLAFLSDFKACISAIRKGREQNSSIAQ